MLRVLCRSPYSLLTLSGHIIAPAKMADCKKDLNRLQRLKTKARRPFGTGEWGDVERAKAKIIASLMYMSMLDSKTALNLTLVLTAGYQGICFPYAAVLTSDAEISRYVFVETLNWCA